MHLSLITHIICSYSSTNFRPATRDTSNELIAQEIRHELNIIDFAKWRDGNNSITFDTIIEGVTFQTTLSNRDGNGPNFGPKLLVTADSEGTYAFNFSSEPSEFEDSTFFTKSIVKSKPINPEITYVLFVPKKKIPAIENGTKEREAESSKAFQSLEFTDATVKTENNEFRVHKFILAAHSEFFKNTFTTTHEFQESRSGVVTLQASSQSVKNALSYMYTGKVDEDFDPVEGFALAKFLASPSYMQFCKSKVILNLNEENATDALLMLKFDEEEDLKRYVFEFLKDNKAARNATKMNDLPNESMNEFMQFM